MAKVYKISKMYTFVRCTFIMETLKFTRLLKHMLQDHLVNLGNNEGSEQSINDSNKWSIVKLAADYIATEVTSQLLEEPKRLPSTPSGKRQRRGKPLRDSIKSEDLKRIQNAIRLKNHSQLTLSRVKVACTIMYYTGMRISEVSLLTSEDVNKLIVEGTIDIYRPKQKNYHRCRIIKEAQHEIYVALKNELGIVFRSSFTISGTMSTRAFTVQVNKYIKKYLPDRPNLSSHSFRISYVSWLLGIANLSLQDAARIVGHSSVQTTNLYYRYDGIAENATQLSEKFYERK